MSDEPTPVSQPDHPLAELGLVLESSGDGLAGTAELNGFDTRIRSERIAPIVAWARAHFPGSLDLDHAEGWAGLRPATPGNIPLIGRSTRPNLWLNTGHGTLGWTLACGSAAALARACRQLCFCSRALSRLVESVPAHSPTRPPNPL